MSREATTRCPTREVTTRRWLVGLLVGLAGWAAFVGRAMAADPEPLTLTLTTNQVDFAAGDQLQVAVGMENTGLPGTAADVFIGVILPDGSTVVAFGPGGPGVGTLANLATLPAFARGVSLASPFTLPAQTILEYEWTGAEPPGQYRLFAAAVRTGGLADGSLGPGDLLTLATRILRLDEGVGGAADWHAFSDAQTIESTADVLTSLRARAAATCGGDRPPLETLSLPDALGRLVAGLETLAGQPALLGFLGSLSDLGRVPAIATAAVAGGKPHAALAALLASAVVEPGNPAHLVNAAGLASLLGFPSEALGLLAAAEALGLDAFSPLGIPGRALALNNRGHALLGLGRFAEAQAALEEAADLAPSLAEARRNLSLALLCQADEDRAVRLSRAGRWRTLGLPIAAETQPTGPPAISPDTVVTVQAPRPTASEAPPTAGLLTVRRIGDPGQALTVNYEVGGTATPDADYVALSGEVTIPAGVFSVDIPILPRRDDDVEPDETVVLTLAPGPGYVVGPAESATVTIGAFLLPAGRVRQATLVDPLDGVVEIPRLFDLSAGVEGRLPTLPYPETPEQTVPIRFLYEALSQQHSEWLAQRHARLQQIRDLILVRPPLPRLAFFRIHDIVIAIYTATSEPTLSPLWAEVQAATDTVDAIHDDLQRTLSGNEQRYFDARAACLFHPGYDACVQRATDQYICQPIRASFPRWRPAMARLDTAMHTFFGPWSTHATALAANIAEPLDHEQIMIDGVEIHADFLLYIWLMNTAWFYSSTVALHFDTGGPYGCLTTEPAPPDNPTGTPEVTDPGACPPVLKAAKVQLKFVEVLSVAFNCETVEIEVAEPGLGFFGQVIFKGRPGELAEATLFIGAKASVPLTGLSAKEGFFLRTDGRELTDAGFKVSASNVLGGPAGGLKVDSPANMEFGLAAATQYWGAR